MRIGITKIRVTNFKNFEELEIELGKFNVLIGNNAAGKSNFVEIFRFLRDIELEGIKNAVSMHGGVELLSNINIGNTKEITVQIVSDDLIVINKLHNKIPKQRIKIYETSYEFSLKIGREGTDFKIIKDVLVQKCKFFKLNNETEESLGEGTIKLFCADGKINTELEKIGETLIEVDDIYPYLETIEFDSSKLLFKNISNYIHLWNFFAFSIHDFDPRLSKKIMRIAGKAELEENGSNLPICLKNILSNPQKKRTFLNLVKDVLPFIKNLEVEKLSDSSLLFKINEKYNKDQYLPATFISNGTINIIALIIALYFEDKAPIIIEEPERNIHPHLISKIVEMMKDASNKKQIIITTHNPEMIRNVDLHDILLVSRDEKGYSTISRPIDSKEVQIFLENEIGIEELYIQNLLGV